MRELMQRLTDYSMQIPPDYKTISRLVIECDGQIRFTPRAKQLLNGMFGYHGININQIQTISQYEVACERIIQNIVSALPTPSNGNTSGAELEKILDEIFSESDHGIWVNGFTIHSIEYGYMLLNTSAGRNTVRRKYPGGSPGTHVSWQCL